MDKNEELRKILAGRKAKTTTQNSNLDSRNSNSNLNSRLSNQSSNLNNQNLHKNLNNPNLNTKNHTKDITTNSMFKKDELQNKRDYDKEPLIIKDYNLIIFRMFLMLCFGIYFIFIITNIQISNNSKTPIGISILLIFYANEVFFTANNRFVEFKNSYIDYKINGVLEKRIKLKNIKNLYKNSSFQYKYLNKRKRVLLVYLYILIVCIIYPNLTILFCLTFIILFLPKFFYQYKLSGNIHFYSSLLIEDEDRQINLCLLDEKTKKELKEYFLIKKEINMDKLEKILYPF